MVWSQPRSKKYRCGTKLVVQLILTDVNVEYASYESSDTLRTFGAILQMLFWGRKGWRRVFRHRRQLISDTTITLGWMNVQKDPCFSTIEVLLRYRPSQSRWTQQDVQRWWWYYRRSRSWEMICLLTGDSPEVSIISSASLFGRFCCP